MIETNRILKIVLSKGNSKANCGSFLCVKNQNSLFFIPRLKVIFAKFDEVQNSGGMILSVNKGKNNEIFLL